MLYTAFLLGLISSFHCVGMCGPIAMMLPVDRKNAAKMVLQILTYHLGRLTTYSGMGLIFGLLGRGLFLAGFQQQLSILIGIGMIVVILVPEKTFSKYNFSRPLFGLISRIKQRLGGYFRTKSFKSLYIIGLLNGFLPCGMVYMALFGAIAMQTAAYGLLYMLIFGLGTLPLMSLVVYVNSFLSISFRNKVQKVIPYVGLLIGLLFILRGLGLGIPYISPSSMSLFVQETANCH